jgi:hypothetical protein
MLRSIVKLTLTVAVYFLIALIKLASVAVTVLRVSVLLSFGLIQSLIVIIHHVLDIVEVLQDVLQYIL